MPYETAIRCCAENLDLLQADVDAGDGDAIVLWNLSAALKDLAEGLRADTHDVLATLEAVQHALHARGPQTP